MTGQMEYSKMTDKQVEKIFGKKVLNYVRAHAPGDDPPFRVGGGLLGPIGPLGFRFIPRLSGPL